MTIREVIITDVTTYGDLYCVAGWDVDAQVMVRPEPPTAKAAVEASRFWSADWAGPGKYFSVGNVVQFEAVAPPNDFPFPHATEDCIFVKAIGNGPIRTLTTTELVASVGTSAGVKAVFGGGLIQAPSGKAYVNKDFRGPSLGAITTATENLRVFENSYDPAKPKLRALLTEGLVTYDVGVTAHAARKRWIDANLDALQADIAAAEEVHIRLGLSRPFPERPSECYVQINGLFLL